MTGVTKDDEVTLLQPCHLEDQADEEERLILQPTHLRRDDLSPSLVLFASVILVFSATAMVVSLPVYLQAVNISGSAYSATLFVCLVVSNLVGIYCYTIYYPRLTSARSFNAKICRKVCVYGFWHGIACISVVYSLDRKRVLCHAQEPLMGLIVLYMILLYCFYKGPVMSGLKLLCLCGVLAGLFLAMDFQLNDIYLCRGQIKTSTQLDGGQWSTQEHALWTIVYAGALFIYTMTWIKLENLLSQMSKLHCSNEELSTVSGQMLLNGRAPAALQSTSLNQQYGLDKERPQEIAMTINDGHSFSHSSSCQSLLSFTPSMYSSSFSSSLHASSFTRDRLNFLLLYFVFCSLLAIVSLCWTDFFSSLGKSGSASQFLNLTVSGLLCHFKGLECCGPTAIYGWTMVVHMLLFLWSMRELSLSSHSLIYPLSVASLSLPLSAIFWGLFTEGGPYGIIWAPSMTGELVFSSLGFPIMVIFLACWAKLDRKETNRGFCQSSYPTISTVAETSHTVIDVNTQETQMTAETSAGRAERNERIAGVNTIEEETNIAGGGVKVISGGPIESSAGRRAGGEEGSIAGAAENGTRGEKIIAGDESIAGGAGSERPFIAEGGERVVGGIREKDIAEVH